MSNPTIDILKGCYGQYTLKTDAAESLVQLENVRTGERFIIPNSAFERLADQYLAEPIEPITPNLPVHGTIESNRMNDIFLSLMDFAHLLGAFILIEAIAAFGLIILASGIDAVRSIINGKNESR